MLAAGLLGSSLTTSTSIASAPPGLCFVGPASGMYWMTHTAAGQLRRFSGLQYSPAPPTLVFQFGCVDIQRSLLLIFDHFPGNPRLLTCSPPLLKNGHHPHSSVTSAGTRSQISSVPRYWRKDSMPALTLRTRPM